MAITASCSPRRASLRTSCSISSRPSPAINRCWIAFASARASQLDRRGRRVGPARRARCCCRTRTPDLCKDLAAPPQRNAADALVSVTFLELVDLASERLGGSVVAANDEFFGPKENLVRFTAPEWREGEYTDRGKWVDGWETRRRREPGDDWCIVRLGVPGIVRGVDVDTTYFTGNHPEACMLDACDLPGVRSLDELQNCRWLELLPRTELSGNSHNLFPVDSMFRASHVRLRIFPDGGVARLRVHGIVAPDWFALRRRGEIDLAAIEHGGLVVACSDMFFGSRQNLIMPGASRNMADGWETKRRRGPGHDWAIVKLGTPGTVVRIEVDTRHFKGNAPNACAFEGCVTQLDAAVIDASDIEWRELLSLAPLCPHARHTFEDEVKPIGNISHARFNIYPDGGVGRLRLFGHPAP
ncbi:MAG: allantoicase [Blastocatellia bacterium]|nr:MAG: allantoicase [Blastocatellia bacterium]